MTNNCLNLSVIPQFRGTCWFNAILMISLYSQNVRKILIKVSKKWDKSNSFLMILKAILLKYYNKKPEKVQKFFDKIRPEIIMFKMLKLIDDKEIIKCFKHPKDKITYMSDFAWNNSIFIHTFFKYLHINTLDISYVNKQYYIHRENEYTYKCGDKGGIFPSYKYANEILDEKKRREIIRKNFFERIKILNDIPDIIILKHEDLFDKIKIPLMSYTKIDPIKNLFDVKGIDTYDDIIYLNGHKYKLDAVPISNYNNYFSVNHAITGITCNNNRYVYNGWLKNTNDAAMINVKEKNNNIYPCSLMKHNWNVKNDEGFCLNQKTCKLDFFKPNEEPLNLCFSFSKGLRMLIYARVLDDKDDKDKENAKDIPDKINLSGVSDVIRDIYDVKDLTMDELKNKLYISKFDNKTYTRDELEKMFLANLKKFYKYNSSIDIKTPLNEKKILKNDLIEMIKEKYPKMKNLKSKTKAQLQEILQL